MLNWQPMTDEDVEWVNNPTKLIEKAAVIQKLIKLIVDEAIKKGDANVAE